MSSSIPTTMQAVAIDAFGGIDQLKLQTLPVPKVDADEVLIRVEAAGVAAWDPNERQGDFDGMVKQFTGKPTKFPLILGSEGAGTIAAVGANVTKFKVGDRVYAAQLLNPKGGFYAEYAVAKADVTATIPGKLTTEQAAAMAGDAGTALRGLDDVLHVKSGETAMIFGAGGGLGHLAVQLAHRLGAKVFAVASGDDGVALARKLGVDAAVNGRKEVVVAAAKAFAPKGIDAAIFTAGGDAADNATAALRDGGRLAYPNGVMPPPKPRSGIKVDVFDGNHDSDLLARLNRHIDDAFVVHVAKSFPMANAADAHRFLDEHYLGKVALQLH